MVYGSAPWNFTGRALYQLQLVPAEEARKYVPEDFKLVEAFGWTLGGVYLARYVDSPVGAFDECVVMAGLVWNPPTSCAWAGRVYVSNREARDHGLGHVGLPSRLAAFEGVAAAPTAPRGRSWWRKGGGGAQQGEQAAAAAGAAGLGAKLLPGGFVDAVELRNVERGRRGLAFPVATFKLPPIQTEGFLGPRMRLALPSFSGGTPEHPSLLQYSCDLRTNVMPVTPMTVQLHGGAGSTSNQQQQQQQQQQQEKQRAGGRWWWWQPQQQRPGAAAGGEALDALLGGRPLLTLAFSDMVMKVEEPLHLPSPAPAPLPGQRAAMLATVPPRP